MTDQVAVFAGRITLHEPEADVPTHEPQTQELEAAIKAMIAEQFGYDANVDLSRTDE